MKLEDFVDIKVDEVIKDYDNNQYRDMENMFVDFRQQVRDFVCDNYKGCDCVVVEYDEDYDTVEETIHRALTSIKNKRLEDFMTTCLNGVDLYILIVK